MRETDMDPFPTRRFGGGLKRRAVLTMMIQLGLSIAGLSTAGRASGQPAPEPGDTTSVTLDEFSRDHTIFDSGAARGQNAVAIPLTVTSVDAPDGAEVEIRFVRADTGAEVYPWRKLSGTLSGGTLSATYFQPTGARSVHWLRPQARVVGSSVVTQATNTCGAGHVWAFWSQSEYARIPNQDTQNYGGQSVTVTNEGDVQVAAMGDPDMTPVLTSNSGEKRTTAPICDMANALAALAPGQKFAIGWHTNGGSTIGDAMTNPADVPNPGDPDEDTIYGATGATGREFNDERLLHETLTRDGSPVGAAWIGHWFANHRGSDPLPELFTQFFFHRDKDGNTNDPAANGGVPRTPNADVRGLYDPDTNPDGGFYFFDPAADQPTKLGWMGPHDDRKEFGGGEQAGDYATVFDIPRSDGTSATAYRKYIRDVDEFFNKKGWPEMLPWYGHTVGAERGRFSATENDYWVDELHFNGRTPDGSSRFLRLAIWQACQSAGIIPPQQAKLDRRFDAADLTFIDFGIDGVDVETERRARAAEGTLDTTSNPENPQLADPDNADSTIYPWTENLPASHHTEVMGWYLDGYPMDNCVIHTITQSDLDDNPGHFASLGQKVCRVRPQNGAAAFNPLDTPIYGYDTMPGYHVDQDNPRHTWLDWLVADIGQPDAVMPRLPVLMQGDFEEFVLPPTSAPEMVNTNDSYIASGGSGGDAASSNMIWRVYARVNELPQGASADIIIGFAGGDCFMQLEPTGTLRIKNDSDILDLFGYVQEGAFFYVEVHMTIGGDIVAYDQKGNVVGSTAFARPNFAIAGADKISFFAFPNGNDTLADADVVECKVWIDQPDTTGAPDFGIEGAAGDPPYTLTGFTEGQINGSFPDGSLA